MVQVAKGWDQCGPIATALPCPGAGVSLAGRSLQPGAWKCSWAHSSVSKALMCFLDSPERAYE